MDEIPIELQADIILAAAEEGTLEVVEDRVKGQFTFKGGPLIV